MKPFFTKIIATLGPATNEAEKINSLMQAGANAFRLNFSHGTRSEQQKRFECIRALSKKTNQHYSILADMQGPKLRVGEFENGSICLKAGASFELDTNPQKGNAKRVNLPHPEIYKAVQKNDLLLLNDGQIKLKITSVSSKSMIGKAA